MKATMLAKLIGMPLNLARLVVSQEGHVAEEYPHKTIITLQARPNTVLLFHKDGRVAHASAGDPLELTEQ
jgi:hypothetical protein